MRLAVQKWGNSLALRIPKSLAEAAGVRQGTEVDVNVRDGCLVAEAVVRVPTLDELLADFPGADVEAYEDVSGTLGREAWPDDAARGREVIEGWR